MAIYDFKCRDCHKTEEKVYRMSEVPKESTCTSCGGISTQVFTVLPTVSVPPPHQASPDKFKYHGVKNVVTGEMYKRRPGTRNK